MTTATARDAHAPCALGATASSSSLAELRAAIVCGAANNQLSSASVEPELQDRSITWVPDDVATSGGLIQVAGEREHKSAGAVPAQVVDVYETVCRILTCAADHDLTAGAAADHFADAHLPAAVR